MICLFLGKMGEQSGYMWWSSIVIVFLAILVSHTFAFTDPTEGNLRFNFISLFIYFFWVIL